MDRISDLPTLAARLGPVVYAPDRLAALNAAGVDLGPAIPADVRAALTADPLGSAGRIAGAAKAGPTVPISITAHERPRPDPRPRPREAARSRTASGFDIVATVFLSSVADIVAKLWEALAYPQDIAAGDVAMLFDAAGLSSFFTGVPDGAEVGPILFPAPPALRVDASDVVALEQPFRAQLIAPAGPVELIATATVRIPVRLIVPAHRRHLHRVSDHRVVQQERGRLLAGRAAARQRRLPPDRPALRRTPIDRNRPRLWCLVPRTR